MTIEEQSLRVYRGIPRSGKSTLAMAWVAENPGGRVRINRDDIRFQLYGKYWGLDRHQEETVSTMEHAMVTAALKAKLSVAVDATNLRLKTVREWQSKAEKMKIPLIIEDVPVDVEEAVRRDKAATDRQVGEDVIRNFHQRYITKGKFPAVPPFESEGTEAGKWTTYVPDESLPKAYLFDIDGTLMKMFGRGPFDWHRVGEDTPIEDVMRVARTLQKEYPIISLSGRDEVCHDDSINSLIENGVFPTALYMRPAGSFIPDDIVKHELFYKYVAPNYNIVGVFDDRLKVCRMWEEIGLTLFRVGPIDADF